MRIEQLEYFVDVAKTHSLNISAERLFVTQPTISEAIHKLEEELGSDLLLRSKKGVALTESGDVVLQWAQKILDDVAEMREAILELENHSNAELNGDICIGATNLVSSLILPDIIEGFGKRYPNVCVTNFCIRHYEITEFLEKNTIDLALFNLFKIPDFVQENSGALKNNLLQKYCCENIYEEPIFVIAGKNMAISKKKQVNLKEVLQYPLIMMQSHLHEQNDVVRLLQKIAEPNIVLKTDNAKMIRQAILGGRGIGLVTKSSCGRAFFNEVQDSDLVRIVKLEEDILLQYFVGIKPDKHLSMVEKAFIDYVKEIIVKEKR